MRADYIVEILNRFKELPYKCILFDGAWGIGKTYAVNEALEKDKNVCWISIFGLQDSQQIYHEALFQLILNSSARGQAGETVSNIFDGLSSIWGKADQVKKVIRSVVKEKELFISLSRQFDSYHIIVIDDLERASDKLGMEEVFGIVEELKQCEYIKVVLIANTEEIEDNKKKEIFDKYNEKVIDKIYHITERPAKADWKKLNIHAEFINGFLSLHPVKNLRTLQKAQNFYEDVKLYCSEIEDNQYSDEIRLICFAIAVEATDNLYYKEVDENEKDDMKKILAIQGNELEQRIMKYLPAIRSSRGLVSMLLAYYENGRSLSAEQMKAEYELFLEAGNAPNYYKSDDEIKIRLSELSNKIAYTDEIYQLLKFADEYVYWSDIVKEDSQRLVERFRKRLCEMLQDEALKGNEDYIGFYETSFLSTEEIREIYREERNNARKFMIKQLVEKVSEKNRGSEAFDNSYKLRNYFKNSPYKEFIKDNIDRLYNGNFLPVGSIDEKRYYMCYNIMYILYKDNAERLRDYCNKEKETCDNISIRRIDEILKKLTEE